MRTARRWLIGCLLGAAIRLADGGPGTGTGVRASVRRRRDPGLARRFRDRDRADHVLVRRLVLRCLPRDPSWRRRIDQRRRRQRGAEPTTGRVHRPSLARAGRRAHSAPRTWATGSGLCGTTRRPTSSEPSPSATGSPIWPRLGTTSSTSIFRFGDRSGRCRWTGSPPASPSPAHPNRSLSGATRLRSRAQRRSVPTVGLQSWRPPMFPPGSGSSSGWLSAEMLSSRCAVPGSGRETGCPRSAPRRSGPRSRPAGMPPTHAS